MTYKQNIRTTRRNQPHDRHIHGDASICAFFPRTFLSGVGLGSFCAARMAETRPRAAVLRSGRYPLFEYFAVAPSVLRPPERLRIVAVDLPELTAKGDDFLRVVI